MRIFVTRLQPILRCVALAMPGLAAAGGAGANEAEYDCRSFIAPAERYYGLPPGLLGAMAMVESGYRGAPHPWALNIAGQAVMAPDYPTAASLLREQDGRIRRDVAIGCLQIHMGYHLAQFGAPEWALLPRYNVWYAALFLRQLGERYGTWAAAIAHYHASDPAAERIYLCQVARQLQNRAPTTRIAVGLALCGPAKPSAALPRADDPVMAARRRGGLQLLGGGS
jgi:hypothetical protein